MILRRTASVLGSSVLVLLAHAGIASAHGVDVTADVDGTEVTLQLTDETGEVCVLSEPAPPDTAVFAIVEDATDDILVILGEGFDDQQRCAFFDVDVVNGVLDDVDAHRLVIAFANEESSGALTKPPPPESETATGTTSASGDTTEIEPAEVNAPLVFGVGAALGVAGVMIRKRFFSGERSAKR